MRIYKVGDKFGVVRDFRGDDGELVRVESLQPDGTWEKLSGGFPNGEAGFFAQLEAKFVDQTRS